jgi:hypothetical protein
MNLVVVALVRRVLGDAAADEVLATVDLGPEGPAVVAGPVPRADIAHALHVVMFADLMEVVPSAAAYAVDQRAAGRRVVLDHAAVRTVAWPAGAPPTRSPGCG